MLSLFPNEETMIPQARHLTQLCIHEIYYAEGELPDDPHQQGRLVAHLAGRMLSEAVIKGVVKKGMIERWVMEAISALKQREKNG